MDDRGELVIFETIQGMLCYAKVQQGGRRRKKKRCLCTEREREPEDVDIHAFFSLLLSFCCWWWYYFRMRLTLRFSRARIEQGAPVTRWCRLRASCLAKDLLQCWQVYGFNPKWSLAWRLRSCCRANCREQPGYSQAYGFSAVWVRLWDFRL